MSYDAIVIGLGGMGSAAAYHLARRGHRVLGLEQYTPAHALGSSHGGSRIVRQAYFEDPAYVPLLLRSYQLWDELAVAGGVELLTRSGGLYVGRPDSAVVAGSVAAAQKYGLGHDVLDAASLRERYGFHVADADVGVLETAAGFTRPERTVEVHLALAAAAGAELRFTEPVVEWIQDRSGGVSVRTGSATYSAERLVVTPGAWAPAVLADLGVPMQIERQVLFWLQPTAGLSAYQPDRWPIWIWEDVGGQQLYGFPALDGPAGGVKLSFYRHGSVTDPDTVDRAVAAAEVDFLRDYVATRIPTFGGPLVRAVACLYTNTPDLDFVVGPHPRHDDVVVACGFSGHGFKFVPVIGEILADLVESGRTDHPIGLFDPTRFAAR